MSIFLHAGFRTASTLLWSALRATPEVVTFFEPMHETLEKLPPASETAVAAEISNGLHEGADLDDVFSAYRQFVAELGGVRGYRKSFSYDRFFLAPDEANPQLELYFRGLIEHAATLNRTAAFKCVRTGGRVAWLKQQFAGQHIGLLRDPISQFSSYMWNARRGNPYFAGIACLLYARNVLCSAPEFATYLRLPLFHSLHFWEEIAFYENVARSLTQRELYFAFYVVWKKSFIHTLNHADFSLSVDAGGSSLARAADQLGSNGRLLTELSVRPSRANGALVNGRELRLVEDLADWLLATHPRHERLASSPSAEDAQLCGPLQERIDKTLALQAGELPLQGELGEAICSVARPPGLEPRSLFPLRPRPAPYPHHSHRRLTDADTTLRFDAASLYLGGDVRVDLDSELQISVVTFESSDEVAAFGPHFELSAGLYELEFEYECTGRSHADGQAGLGLAIVADYGRQIIHPEQLFPPTSRSRGRVLFSLSQRATAFEPRFHGRSASGRLFGYTIRLLSETAVASETPVRHRHSAPTAT
jgi:hypothetical protein